MQTQKTVEQARTEIRAVLRHYGVTWDDIAPSRDAGMFAALKKAGRQITKRDVQAAVRWARQKAATR